MLSFRLLKQMHALLYVSAAAAVTWEVVNLDCVSGPHLKDPGVWVAATVSNFSACQTLCANNATCNACDWAGDLADCPWNNLCYFRSDHVWKPHISSSKCNHTSARKVVPTPAPPPSPPSPQPCAFVKCSSDSDCISSTTCSWCRSLHPGIKNIQSCAGPPKPGDCGTLPGPATNLSKLQYSCFGDSVSKGIFKALAPLASAWESFHPSINEGGGCGNTVRGKDCTRYWLNGDSNASAAARAWDIVTFNFGLHDLANDTERVSINDYKLNLRNITSTLQAAKERTSRHLRLFWLSSTPVPNVPLSPPRAQDDVPRYNLAASDVMRDMGVPIVDLYSFVIKQCGGNESYTSCPGFQQPKGVHFEQEGYQAMAKFIQNAVMNY